MADTEGQMAERRGPGRPPRALTERTERRRRKGTAERSILDVDADTAAKLASEGLEGRWINDVDNRMYDKTKNDDWTPVDGVEARQVGTDKRNGNPIMARYCAKPKSFLQEDRAERLNAIKAQERAIVRGADNSELGADDGAYQPKSANRIGNTI
jgi:hypothetical protein